MLQSHVQDATDGGRSESSTKGPRGSLEKLVRLTDEQKSLSAQAKWYVYSSCYVSKRTFKDKHFKSMLRAVARSNAAPILTQYMLKEYVRAEFSVFLLFLALIIKLKMGQSHDAPFAQAQHDGGTAANKKKYQALAMQFIDPKWLRNLVICIGFKYSPQNKDADVPRSSTPHAWSAADMPSLPSRAAWCPTPPPRVFRGQQRSRWRRLATCTTAAKWASRPPGASCVREKSTR